MISIEIYDGNSWTPFVPTVVTSGEGSPSDATEGLVYIDDTDNDTPFCQKVFFKMTGTGTGTPYQKEDLTSAESLSW